MKRFLLCACFSLGVHCSFAQTAADTITAADMPIVGDTLIYSSPSSPFNDTTAVNLAHIWGANVTWDFSYVVRASQGVDTYKTASQVDTAYSSLDPSYGYYTGDAISGLPYTVQNPYAFFNIQTSPSSYSLTAAALVTNGTPTAFPYTIPDVYYYFPLAYGKPQDSSKFSLNMLLPSIGGMIQGGYRLTKVVGWGTIKTPYFTSPQNCILIRSEIHGVDTLVTGTSFSPSPYVQIEYKWLIKGEHYPAMWLLFFDSSESDISGYTFMDGQRTDLRNITVKPEIVMLNAFPNPAVSGITHLEIPQAWQEFSVKVYDMQGKLAAVFNDEKELHLESLPSGQYLVCVISGMNRGYVKIMK